MRTVIIEDNAFDAQILEKLIKKDPELDLVGIFSDAIEAISLIKSKQPELIFLDIELPGMTGIEFLQAIKNVPQIIMTTVHTKYALEAFENDVTDFIAKPVDQERFKKAVDKAKQMHQWLSLSAEEDEHIFIRVDRANVKLDLNEIKFIEAQGDYVRVHTEQKKYMVLTTMKAIGSKLPSKKIVRVHRSFFVNADCVKSYDRERVVIDDQEIPLTKNGYNELKNALVQEL